MAITTETVWWIERDEVAIAEKSGDVYSGPAVGKTVYLYCTKNDNKFTTSAANGTSPPSEIGLNDAPGIPEEFHEYLVNYVLWKGYEKKIASDVNMLRAAAHFETRWKEGIREGKRHAKVGRDSSPFSVAGYDY